MRRLGLVAAGSVACALAGASLGLWSRGAEAAGQILPAAQPSASPHNLALEMVMSRGHDVLTVVLKNDGPGPICVDVDYTAPGRLTAFAKNGAPIANLATPPRSRNACSPLEARKTLHAGYDLRPIFPLGLPGAGKLCYQASWKTGGPNSRDPQMRSSHCMVLPPEGVGRR
ncbi:MAG TPA: hypothetical protein VGL66_01475 [Caulobacteraceae bacterium]|jgi:hypothetical protein